MHTTLQNKYSSLLKRLGLIIAAILLHAATVAGQTYTISPPPFLIASDDSNNPIVAGCVWTYAAGTTTPISTYSNNSGTTNTDPIIADAAGRFTAYLLAGVNYKFVYETACTPPAHGSVLRTADNIAGTPGAAATVDVTGTAGETLSAGNCTYLSDGSGSKNAGQWYKCDSAQTYSSTTPTIGIANAAIIAAAQGSIRLAGSVSGLSSLSAGADYYVSGTAGALTSTAPTNRRRVGQADSSTTLVLSGNPPIPVSTTQIADEFRLSLTSGACVTPTDVTAATTLYLTPCSGNRFTVSDSSGVLTILTSAEISIAVPATTATVYDVWAYSSSGTLTLELTAWTNDTTRATAIARTTTAFYTKSADLTRRYVGSFRTTAVSGQTEDSALKRYVWNYYNRTRRSLFVTDATDTWAYTTATWRQANASTANQVDVVVGVAEVPITLTVAAEASNSAADAMVFCGIGEDSTTVPHAKLVGKPFHIGAAATTHGNGFAHLTIFPAVGRHFYAWLEKGNGTNTTTWIGDNGNATDWTMGLSGFIEG